MESAVTESAVTREQAEAAYRAAVESYIETRSRRVPYFIRRHFGFHGTLRIHRAAFGWDLLRAPANIALAVPHLLKLLAGGLCRWGGAPRWADRIGALRTQIPTDVERAIDWLVWTELLELPHRQKDRVSERDALAGFILTQPAVVQAIAALTGDAGGSPQGSKDASPDAGGVPPVRRARLEENLSKYTGARSAAAEIATAFASAGVGGLAVQQLTPTAISLGPPVAALLAHQAAVVAFPFGSGLGGLWYAVFPAEPSGLLVWSVTGGLIGLSAVVAAFAGIVADPVQRALGIHRRRLDRFVEAVGRDLAGEGPARFKVRAHYVARLFDFFEAVRLAVRAAT